MTTTQSRDFKLKYQRCKLKVKEWEEEFKKENGRPPTKDDIKTSSSKVKEYYKMYYRLKMQLLEEEILGDTSTDSSKDTKSKSSLAHIKNVKDTSTDLHEDMKLSSSAAQNVGITSSDLSKITESNSRLGQINDIADTSTNSNKDTVSNSDAAPNQNVKNSHAETVLKEQTNIIPEKPKIDEKTWGSHLNKPKTIEATMKRSFSCNISEKLFEGSKFKKRNPRKSFSLNKTKSNLSIAASDVSLSKDDSFQGPDSPFMELSQDVDTSINEQSFSVENDVSPKIKELITTKSDLSPFLRNEKFRIVSEPALIINQPVSLIQKVVSEPNKTFKSVRKLDVGWLDRCGEIENPPEQRLSSDSGFESMESSRQSLSEASKDNIEEKSEDNKEENIFDDDDDDEVIDGSDNEFDNSSQFDFSFLSQPQKIMETTQEASQPEEPEVSKKRKIDVFEFPDLPSEPPSKIMKSSTDIKKERLEQKMKSGTLNDNFVAINLKKKVFVRGKKRFNFAKHKKQQWKKKKKSAAEERESGGIIRCFKCGDVGHFARYCQKNVGDKLLSGGEEEEEEDSPLPTLEEAESMAQEKADQVHRKKNVLCLVPEPEEEEADLPVVGPLYQPNEDGTLIDTPDEVHDALNKFGHLKFRPGQEEAVMRILSGQSTLVTISTGGGKSLCYQLPAYMYASKERCITLVVSPLVSLMEDQVSGSSSFFKLGCLHTNQTPKQREAVLEDAKAGKLFALLVSPEAVVAGENSSGLGITFKQLPPIAFACIDEVHCVSQWSHNFRPSYLMICKVLREKFGIKTILGLTATATKTTITSITRELGISNQAGVIKDIPLPDNLCLSISRDENKDRALLDLLRSPRFRDANAILIYCTRRDECERLAVLIRTSIQDVRKTGPSKRLSWNAESYHAGMSSSRRKQVQKAFMCGNLRIVVATVAFGMGINKRDIRAVIHYNMTKDFESYVQEVGRAGRDGMLAHCHLFLDSNGKDLNELRRHIYSNTVDRFVLRKLLEKVFIECKCKSKEITCKGHEVAFDCNDTIHALDIPEENIYTLLCYLELHPKKLIKVLTPVYTNCKIQSYKGAKALHNAAKKCPPLAVACALDAKKTGSLNFNVVEIARTISWDSGVVKNQLKNTEWDKTNDKWKKTGIVVDFSNLGFRVFSRGDMTPSELDEALDYLIKRVEDQEKRAAVQLEVVYSAFSHFSVAKYKEVEEDYDKGKSDKLKQVIREYFETEKLPEEISIKKIEEEEFDEESVASDVRGLVCTYRDNNFNGRAVARIFHGIQSPNYPASIWFKCRFWRHHIDKNFNRITRIATREILRLK